MRIMYFAIWLAFVIVATVIGRVLHLGNWIYLFVILAAVAGSITGAVMHSYFFDSATWSDDDGRASDN